MTEIATRDNSAIGAFDPRDEKVLNYLGFSPADPKARAVVAVARRYDLDPLLKHVIVIPKGGVYITRDGLLHVAHASGQLDGIVVEQEPSLSEDGSEWVARVSVWRKDMRHPFTYPGRYSARGGGNAQYAPEMALKAAEAHALRRAFDVTGLPTEDEQRPVEEPRRVRASDVVRQPAEPGPDSVPEPPADEPVDAVIVDPDEQAAEEAAAESQTGEGGAS